MKKTTHTNAPWILDNSKRSIYGLNRDRTESEGENVYKKIATVHRTSLVKASEAKANARILASSMDLLSIAKVCIMKLNSVQNHWCRGWSCTECVNSEVTEELVCAVLRAEGKEAEGVSMELVLRYVQEWISEYVQGIKKKGR